MYNFIDKLARLSALTGGLALSGLIVITCVSIVGRMINGVLNNDLFQEYLSDFSDRLIAWGVGPINGDYEIVEAGMAFAIFAFLPLCHLNGAHASVGIFTSKLPDRIRRVLFTIIEIVFAVTLVVIAFQLFQGMESKRSSGQLTFQLQYPIWWAYALSLAGAVIAAVVSVYVAAVRVIEVFSGRTIMPSQLDVSH